MKKTAPSAKDDKKIYVSYEYILTECPLTAQIKSPLTGNKSIRNNDGIELPLLDENPTINSDKTYTYKLKAQIVRPKYRPGEWETNKNSWELFAQNVFENRLIFTWRRMYPFGD